MTVDKLQSDGIFSVNWQQWDVHPPISYLLQTAWSYLNPGFLLHDWLREFSVLCGLVFILFVFLSLHEVFGPAGDIATFFLSLCTTYLHYAGEARMYMLLMMMSAIALYALIREWEGKWFYVFMAIVFMAPLVQYYSGAILSMFLIVLSFVILKLKGIWGSKKWMLAYLLFVAVVGVLVALFCFALPQKARVLGTWFQWSTISSWPSSVFYAFFMTEYFPSNPIFLVLYFIVIGMIVLMMWKVLKIFRKEAKRITVRDGFYAMMILTILAPLVGLVLVKYVLGEGFQNLYHHRFFLPLTWMFAAICFVSVVKWMIDNFDVEKFKGKFMFMFLSGLIVGVMLLMCVLYGLYTHHELQNLIEKTSCNKEGIIYIAHESPFSALPYEVYAREHGCGWYNFVSTNLTVKNLNGGGGDAMPGRIFYNRTLPNKYMSYFYVRAEGTVPIDGETFLIAQEDGVELLLVVRS